MSSKGKFCVQLYRKQDTATCIHKNLFYMVYLDHFWAQTEQNLKKRLICNISTFKESQTSVNFWQNLASTLTCTSNQKLTTHQNEQKRNPLTKLSVIQTMPHSNGFNVSFMKTTKICTVMHPAWRIQKVRNVIQNL